MLVVVIYFVAKFAGALKYIRVDSDAKNVTACVTPNDDIIITWSFQQHDVERITMAISNASNVIGRFQNGEYRCYKDGFLTETECQEHFSLTVNGSSDIIIAMRNISDDHFKSYLISVYGGPDDKIETLWITVCKKGATSQVNETTNEPKAPRPTTPGVASLFNATTNEPKALRTTTPGTGSTTGTSIGVTFGALFLMVLIVGIAIWFCKRCNKLIN